MASRVALLGYFGVGNVGNDSTLQAVLPSLMRLSPGTEVVCVSFDPELVKASFGLTGMRLTGRRGRPGAPVRGPLGRLVRLARRAAGELTHTVEAFRFLGRVDRLVVPGTGVLDDFGLHPLQLPYDLFKWSVLAALRRKGPLLVSVGAGPIRHPASRWLLRTAAWLAPYRSFRDEQSRTFMQTIGLDTRSDPVYPDLAFSLPLPASPKRAPERSRVVVGVGVMAYYGWRDSRAEGAALYRRYLSTIAQFVAWLLGRGYAVRVLIGQAEDREAVADLAAEVARLGAPEAGGMVAEPTLSTEELMRQIGATDFVVATRFHNVLFALMQEKPVVSLGYARKNDALMAEMGLGEFCQGVEAIDLDRLKAQFTELVRTAEPARERIRRKNAEYRRALDEQYRLIVERL